jgi:hypothetical protein
MDKIVLEVIKTHGVVLGILTGYNGTEKVLRQSFEFKRYPEVMFLNALRILVGLAEDQIKEYEVKER